MAVRDIARAFREEHRLAQLPLFFTGCSCGWGGWGGEGVGGLAPCFTRNRLLSAMGVRQVHAQLSTGAGGELGLLPLHRSSI